MAKIVALVAAAGKGTRMEGAMNKQYLLLDKKPILLHTLKAIDQVAEVTEIIVIIGRGEEGLFERTVRGTRFRHRIRTVIGGKERQDSIWNALKILDEDTEYVISHDGARPLVDHRDISRCIREAMRHGAAVLGTPVKDTIKVVTEDHKIDHTPERRHIWAAQTPQVFRYDLLMKAYHKALEEGFVGTDDAMLVERLPYIVRMVQGSYDNLKVTTPHDLIFGEQILRRRMKK